jgi:hypothetical protein
MSYESYSSLKSAIFVRIQVDYYRTGPTGPYRVQLLNFSDFYRPFTINGEVYTALGNLMSLTSSKSELTSSQTELTIVLSGIPNTAISEINNSKIKGCSVRIYRVLFDPNTGAQVGDPIGRYSGYINNYSLQEEWDNETKSSSTTIVLVCGNNVDVLRNKVTGRKTNPSSQQRYFPNDFGFNRVPALKNTTFNFGEEK